MTRITKIGQAKQTLVLAHPTDPRGEASDASDIRFRRLINRRPDDMRLLFLGVDKIGDLPMGRVSTIQLNGRKIDFLPTARMGASRARVSTARFAVSLARRFGAVRRAVGDAPASAEAMRFETALAAKALGLPTVLTLQGDAWDEQSARRQRTPAKIVRAVSERLALSSVDRLLCADEKVLRRLEASAPNAARSADVKTTWVDRDVYAPRSFDCADGVFRVVAAGRLDAAGDRGVFLRVAASLRERLAGRFELHMIDWGESTRRPDGAQLGDSLITHDCRTPERAARIVAGCHAGLLTSFHESLPQRLLEILSIGRPLAAFWRPEFETLIARGQSGRLIDRSESLEACEHAMAAALLEIWSDVTAGRYQPASIGSLVESYSLEPLMNRHFARHRSLAAAEHRPQVGAQGARRRAVSLTP